LLELKQCRGFLGLSQRLQHFHEASQKTLFVGIALDKRTEDCSGVGVVFGIDPCDGQIIVSFMN
jgi:hypothetical protein